MGSRTQHQPLGEFKGGAKKAVADYDKPNRRNITSCIQCTTVMENIQFRLCFTCKILLLVMGLAARRADDGLKFSCRCAPRCLRPWMSVRTTVEAVDASPPSPSSLAATALASGASPKSERSELKWSAVSRAYSQSAPGEEEDEEEEEGPADREATSWRRVVANLEQQRQELINLG